MMAEFFKLRGRLSNRQRLSLEIGGGLFLLLVWFLVTSGEEPVVKKGILPRPVDVFNSFGDLYYDNELIKNICRSIGFNLSGYIEAILLSLPLGFALGLVPFFRGAFQRPVDAIRYVPLPAAIGLFIAWFGLGTGLKVHFLAFGILIYLIPVVVQRIDEVNEVYLKTVFTLGAKSWQTITSVYLPSVFSRLFDDIRILTAISWTYIIIAESIGGEGGIGALIWRVGQRQGRTDKIFALLIIIIVIGIVQDKIFTALDKTFFPFKYEAALSRERGMLKQISVLRVVFNFIVQIISWILIGVYVLLALNEFFPLLTDTKVLSYLFGDTVIAIHLIMGSILIFKLARMVKKNKK
jgi:ABC-type nitrate/sulfonate/bicarbonate transport system permease component